MCTDLLQKAHPPPLTVLILIWSSLPLTPPALGGSLATFLLSLLVSEVVSSAGSVTGERRGRNSTGDLCPKPPNGTAKGFSIAITYQLCLSSETAGTPILQPRRVSAGGSDVPQILTECLLCLVLFQVNGGKDPCCQGRASLPRKQGVSKRPHPGGLVWPGDWDGGAEPGTPFCIMIITQMTGPFFPGHSGLVNLAAGALETRGTSLLGTCFLETS